VATRRDWMRVPNLKFWSVHKTVVNEGPHFELKVEMVPVPEPGQ